MEDQDGLWKEVLEEFFQPFLELLFTDIHQAVDWTQPTQFLDKELQKLQPDSRTGRRQVDKLVEVYFRNGEPRWLLIHVEVQAQADRHFAERMFIYYYRLFDRYRKDILSLAVLADTNTHFRPKHYERMINGIGIRHCFRSIKLLDFRKRQGVLLASTNPFALLIAAHLTATTKTTPRQRADSLLGFYRLALRQSLSREKIERLLLFLEWMVALPPEIESYYTTEVNRMEEESTVTYVSIFERRGIQKGLEEGRVQGQQEGRQQGQQQGRRQGRAAQLLRQLQLKFGDIPPALHQRVETAEEADLNTWAERLLFVNTLEAVFENPHG